MRFVRVCVVVSLSLVLAIPVFPQTSTTQTSPQAVTLLQQSLAALTGGRPITDITLSGTARRIAGSDDESGTATLKAIPGASLLILSLSGGARSEIVNFTTAPAAGSWSGPDGVSHAMANHNLLTEPVWFFPTLAISRRLATSSFVATYVGQETRNGQSVQHISVTQIPPSSAPPGGSAFGHLTLVDFFFDASTLLPAAITFSTHPDSDLGLDIPVEIDFSNYISVSGAQIPFHVQQFLNNSLLLDLQLTNAQPNSGLSASLFEVQ